MISGRIYYGAQIEHIIIDEGCINVQRYGQNIPFASLFEENIALMQDNAHNLTQ